MSCKGAYIKYSRRPGGREGHPNACRLVHGGGGIAALRAHAQKAEMKTMFPKAPKNKPFF